MGKAVKFRIFRYNPEKSPESYEQEYPVNIAQGMSVLDALNEIKWNQDGTLAYRRSCRSGICGSCAMTVNGVNHLACETQVLALGTDVVTVEPLRSLPPLRDLVVEMGVLYDGVKEVKPYFLPKERSPSDKERLQSPEERKKIDGLYECILCGCCTSSCPSFWYNQSYLGPAALLKAYRFEADSRDEGTDERMPVLDDRNGIWRCHTIFNCVAACPKELNPTQAIAELKKLAVKCRV